MSEPTVDEIMEKAKQLCRLDGMLWSKLDFQNPMAQQIRTTARLAGEAVRRRYLKRGADVARHGSPTSAPWKLDLLVPRLAPVGQDNRADRAAHRTSAPTFAAPGLLLGG
jgi:hypothetical protein